MFPMCTLWNADLVKSPFHGRYQPQFDVFDELTLPLHGRFPAKMLFHPYRRTKVPASRRRGLKNRKWMQTLNFAGYRPEDITVKAENGAVRVNAKSEENQNGMLHISETSRYFTLPEGVNPEDIKCLLKEDGRLLLKASLRRKPLKAVTGGTQEKRMVTQINKPSEPEQVQEINKEEKENNSGAEDGAPGKETPKMVHEEKKRKTDNIEVHERSSRMSDNGSHRTVEVEDIEDDDSDTEITEMDDTGDQDIVVLAENNNQDSCITDDEVLPVDDAGDNRGNEKAACQPVSIKDNTVKFDIDLPRPFLPENVKIKQREKILYIDAVEEKNINGMLAKFEFHRQIELPEDALLEQVCAKLNENGKLYVTVPVNDKPAKEVTIAIQHL